MEGQGCMEEQKKEEYLTIKEEIRKQLLGSMDFTREISDDELQEAIAGRLRSRQFSGRLDIYERSRLGKELFFALRGLDILQELIEDEQVTEIMINGLEGIFVERSGRLFAWPGGFESKEKLQNVIQQIVAGCNRTVNEASPIVDARLADGSRVNVVLAPVALNGPVVTIRKFSKEAASMEQLMAWGSISREIAGFLDVLVKSGYNIFISGGTGSGKTTFLNALSQYIPRDERIVTIEDSSELKIQGIPNLVSLEARNANIEGTGAVTIRDLIKAALRMRPTRIIVGEVRSAEAIDMLQAMNTGHDGSLSTGHANSPKDMLSRLETMVLMGMELPLPAIQRQIASALDLIVHLGRLRDKSRKVLEVTEVLGYLEGEICLQTLYRFEEEGMKNGRIEGSWKKYHELSRRDKLLASGYDKTGMAVDHS